MGVSDEISDFYKKHYSDWTVHELPLTVYIPTNSLTREEAREMIQEILDGAAFDIKVRDHD